MLKDEDINPDRVDIVLHSAQIKRMIAKRITEAGVNPVRLCAALKLKYDDLRTYLNTNSIHTRPLSHYDVLRISKQLGLEIRVQVVVSDIDVINPMLRSDVKFRKQDSAESNNEEVTEKLRKITGRNAGTHRNTQDANGTNA
jgi:hypothetical protein